MRFQSHWFWCQMIFIALLIAAAAAPIQVAPADPTAMFKGDGVALKFDPTCRDYTVETVQTNPDCAARIAKGEAAPSLAIAASTLQSLPTKSDDAIKLLNHAAATTDSPAVHYFIGTVLGTGERHQPDYALAVRHLSIAAQRGNPAAADLLATLMIAGKGAPRDLPKAISLYTTAAANGFPSAAMTLGKLYLAGKHVPKDEAKGLAWLKAAAAVDTPGAAQLALLAEAQDKVSNYQLIPSADPSKVKAVRYGTFDNPDIPPSFGFDPYFQAVHDAPYDDAVTLARLKNDAGSMPTPYLYELARRLAANDPDGSLRTYLVARARMTYDASRCADAAALEGIRAWDMVVAPDIRYLFVAGPPSAAIVNAALADEAKLPADNEPWWICRSGMAAMTAAMKGAAGPIALKTADEWPALRKAAQDNLRRLARAQ